MTVLLVCPRFPDSLWSFRGICRLAGVDSAQSPIGLATIAGLTPSEISISLLDENVEPIDLDHHCDVVAISCFNVQYTRALEIAAEFRRRGRLVAFGGPFPTLCPERFEGVADVVFLGEAEYTWPRFCRDLLQGRTPDRVYAQERGKVQLADSPLPRYDLLRAARYLYHYVQTTRGCPFQCEFCDFIVEGEEESHGVPTSGAPVSSAGRATTYWLHRNNSIGEGAFEASSALEGVSQISPDPTLLSTLVRQKHLQILYGLHPRRLHEDRDEV